MGRVETAEVEQRQHAGQAERIEVQLAGRAAGLEGEVRWLALVIDKLQGRQKAPSWRIMLDNESPLSEETISTVISRDFKFSDVKYAGKSDPLVHIEHFNDMTGVQGLTQAQRCRVFSLTLEGRVQEWYRRLPRESIKSFEQMCKEFARQFSEAVVPEDDVIELLGFKQSEDETLREFLKRYHCAVLDLGAFDHPQALKGLKEGVKIGRLWYNLRNPTIQT